MVVRFRIRKKRKLIRLIIKFIKDYQKAQEFITNLRKYLMAGNYFMLLVPYLH